MAHAPPDTFVSPARAAELVGVSRRTIYRHIASGDLAALRFGRAKNAPLRIRTADLVEQLRLPSERTHDHER